MVRNVQVRVLHVGSKSARATPAFVGAVRGGSGSGGPKGSGDCSCADGVASETAGIVAPALGDEMNAANEIHSTTQLTSADATAEYLNRGFSLCGFRAWVTSSSK